MDNIFSYNLIIKKLRTFFQDQKGFVEVPSQTRESILAACEDPSTITQFSIGGVQYPLPQTGQMWLEYEILKNPELNGVFCITTSYRNEPNIIPGRHRRIFPMFEFEAKGDINDLRKLELELLSYLGFDKAKAVSYEDICQLYSISEIDSFHEDKLRKDFGNVLTLEFFPKRTHPFWNMKHDKNGIYKKIDVILYGMETIGSAERSTDKEEMREFFHTISNGNYSKLLFDAFGKDRVIKELDEYLSLPMIPRFGAGIGITRLERAMNLAGLLNNNYDFALNKMPKNSASVSFGL